MCIKLESSTSCVTRIKIVIYIIHGYIVLMLTLLHSMQDTYNHIIYVSMVKLLQLCSYRYTFSMYKYHLLKPFLSYHDGIIDYYLS